MDLATLEQEISTAIGQQETAGGTTGVGATLNNPGGLMYSDWEQQYGATQSASGFAAFPSLTAGFQALQARVSQLVTGGASVSSLINTWSPASAGNTNNDSRISQIASITALNPSQSISAQASSSPSLAAQAAASILGMTTMPSTVASAATTAATSTTGSSTIARIAAGVIGLVCLIMGLMMLKQTQIVIQNVGAAAGKVGEVAATAAAA